MKLIRLILAKFRRRRRMCELSSLQRFIVLGIKR
jgi:hypothetical protein